MFNKYNNASALQVWTAGALLMVHLPYCTADAGGHAELHAKHPGMHHAHHIRGDINKHEILARDPGTKTFIQMETVYVDNSGVILTTVLADPMPQMGQFDNLNIPGLPTSVADYEDITATLAPNHGGYPVTPKDNEAKVELESGPVIKSEELGTKIDSFKTAKADGSTKTQGSSSDSNLNLFKSGKVSCNEFPSKYGALALEHLDLGGWSGIQIGNGAGNECIKGAYCSYACPPGMYKSQWPTEQPANGETRGGLLCNDEGMLELTRPEVPNLCIPGVGSAILVNKMSRGVAVCGTDYPGSENMVVPVFATGGGEEHPLTVVDSESCFIWQGKPTSAQYYVNMAGVSVNDGCRWGEEENNTGNWSPLVFGAGRTEQGSFLSLSPNSLANGKDAGYDVEILPDNGAIMNGKCSYKNGRFISDQGENSTGCTVCVTKGRAKYVFTSRK